MQILPMNVVFGCVTLGEQIQVGLVRPNIVVAESPVTLLTLATSAQTSTEKSDKFIIHPLLLQ